MVQIRRLSDKWLSRYELMKNLHIKGDHRGTVTQTTVVTIKALYTSCSLAKKDINNSINA